MQDTKFYPLLTDILPLENIPNNLGFIQNGIQYFTDGIHYTDLHIEKSIYGDSVFYHINLVALKKIGFEVPGTDGLALLLNPNLTGTNITTIPITLGYQWDILKYAQGRNITQVIADPTVYYNLFKDLANVTDEELLTDFIGAVIEDIDPFQKFVNDYNTIYTLTQISLPPDFDSIEKIKFIINHVDQFSQDLKSIVIQQILDSFATINDALTAVKKLFNKYLGNITDDDIKKLLIPRVRGSIDTISLGLQFPTSILRQVDSFNVPIQDINGDDVPGLLLFDVGSVKYTSENGLEFDLASNFNFTRSEILRSGFILSLQDMKLDLSRTKNIPEATADGRPNDFIGVYIKEGTLEFPANWGHNPSGSTGELYVDNLLAGTGGLSGTIGLRGNIITPATTTTPAVREPNPLISVKFGEKFTASLTSFEITFHQNAIVSSEILGKLTVAGFKDSAGNDAEIDIKIHIDGNGDFYITAKEEDGITLPLHFDEYFTVTVNSLTVGKRSGKFFIATSGVIDFKDLSSHNSFLGNLLPKEIEIQKLLIWENGQIELEGGTVELRKPVKINIGPVKLTITAIGMGSYERMHGGVLRKYKYVEFSAGVSVNPGGVDARGDGIKVYFSIDGGSIDIFVRIESIAIDLIIPGNASKEQATLLLSGYLSMKQPNPSSTESTAGTEFAGGIAFTLPKMKMGGSAFMKYNPDTPAFLIDVSLEISTPIVLGATGMGIYGFRALFGKHYMVSKTEPPVSLPEDAEWWQYYKKKVNPEMKEGITVSKMANLDGFSFGAGVSLATATDGGKAFSAKLFFLLSLPEVFLLQGQAQFLKGRIQLTDPNDPPFYAIIAIDKNSISAGLGMNYKFPDDGASPGKIATVDALTEIAFFWHDSSAWYINVGRDQPVDRRIHARIFDLFDVYAYFMLSAQGIRAGAGASLEKNYKVGPIKARLYAYMDTAGRLAFKPVQIGGSIDIGGGVDIKVCGKGFSLTAHAGLAAEAPKPFIVTGSVEVCVKVLKKEYCIDLDFTWTFEHSLDFSEIPMVTQGLISTGGSPAVSTELQKAVKSLHMVSQEPLDLLCIENINPSGSIPPLTAGVWSGINNYLIPMDSYIDLEFRKPVKPNGDVTLNRFGGVTAGPNYSVYVAPQRGKSNRVRHDFLLKKVEVFSWNPTTNTWDDYHVYNAITPLTAAPFNLTTAQVNDLQFGFWQVDNPGYYTKLRLMAQNPLSFIGQGSGDTVPEDLGVTNAIFCPEDPIEKTCMNFDSYNLKTGQKKLIPAEEIVQQQSVIFRVTSHDSAIIYKPYAGIKDAFAFEGADTMEIYLPEPMAEVSMLLNTITSGLTIKYYIRIQAGLNPSGDPVYGYQLVSTVVKTPAQLTGGVLYSDALNPVVKIEITGGTCTLIPRSNVVCDTTVSGEASDWLKIVNLMAKLRELGKDIKIGDDPRYTSVVAGSAFFPNPTPKGLFYHPTVTSTTLTQTFSGQGYDCQVMLTIPAGQKSDIWTVITRFLNMRPDPAHASTPGGNYFFLVDAVLQNGTVITLSGVSKCLPVYYCYDRCLNFFYQLCYLNVVDYQFNQALPSSSEVNDNNTNMVNAINKTLLPVWRPDTTFAVRVQFRDDIFEESSSHPSVDRAFAFGFRTKGPVGHYHEYPTGDNTSLKQPFYTALEADDKDDQSKVTTLKHYIDYSKSYPNADGNILNAKPLYYYAPELLLFYVYPHVYQFYQDWNAYNGNNAVVSSLDVIIKDPIEPPFVPNPMGPSLPPVINIPPLATNTWEINSFPVITPDIAAMNNMITNGVASGVPCIPSVAALTPNGINNSVTPANPLEPLKLYTAIYQAAYQPGSVTMTAPQKRQVHAYGFQTSRYKDFNEHISSYILQKNATTMAIEKEAVYELKKAFLPATILRAQQTLDGTLPKSDQLHQEAAINFDKLIDRLFEFKELEPAEYLQFNLVIDTNTSNILGILLRSPEPFNDPKTPIAELNSTILMEVNTGSGYDSSTNYAVQFSKDRASAFVTNADNSLNVLRGTHRFTFTYKLYNGSAYVVKATEQVVLDFNAIL